MLDEVCDVKLLAFWYSNQTLRFFWQGYYSDKFYICNAGTRQAGVLSPHLFMRYVRPLRTAIVQSRIDCSIDGFAVNILAYADDMVILAPSWFAMQEMVNVLEANRQLLSEFRYCV